MNEVLYQDIFNALQEVLPNEWNKVVFYAEYDDSSYGMKYYVLHEDGTYSDCFELEDVSKSSIIETFAIIDSIIMPVREKVNKDDLWSVMTIVVSNTGDFKAEYEYEDISDHSIEYFNEWKKKYLI